MMRAPSRSITSTDIRAFRDAVGRLRRRYGPQGWWPRCVRVGRAVEVRHHPGDISKWVVRTDADRAFEVAIGAILTQNTAWKNVETALICLSRAKLLTLKRIVSSRMSKIQQCVRSSGYYHQKAKKLKALAAFVQDACDGDITTLKRDRFARNRLLDVHGIGPETADTILLYGLGMPSFVVDAYTRRFLAEVTGSRRWLLMTYDDVRTFCSDAIPRSVKGWQEAHAVIVAWGKRPRSI